MATNTGVFHWTLTAFENQGNLWLSWSDSAPFRAQQGRLRVYSGNYFPENCDDEIRAWNWDAGGHHSPWDTGQRWGSGWHCAWVAEAPNVGPYVYFVKVITE